MKYLLIALCLVVAGCASHKPPPPKAAKDFKAAMQKVLDARGDIRQIISHPPRTQAEVEGPAQGDPNALLFNVQEFADRLQTIPLDGCPYDFKTAFRNYAEAWKARAAKDPNLLLLYHPGAVASTSHVPAGAEETEATWQTVLSVQASYAVKMPEKDF
jgi:hypothetical protein